MNRLSLPLFATLAAAAPLHAATKQFQQFEGDGFGDWKIEGNAFGLGPVAGKSEGMNDPFRNYAKDILASSANGGDTSTGTLTSPEFTIGEPYISFLLAGGNHPGKTGIELLVDGKSVRSATGNNSLDLMPTTWDVREFKGLKGTIRIFDNERGEWGIIAVDHIIFTNNPNYKFPGPTREGKAFVEGLVATDQIAGAIIPQNSTLKIAADYQTQKVTSPTAITFDDEGNIFASETHRFRHGVEDNRDNLYWYLDDLAAKTTADRRALHEKWKEKRSIKELTEKSEIIRKLSDKDGDGVFEESTVFADGFNDLLDGTGAGVFYFEGSLYFSCIPKIWMLRDTNGDGLADERKVVEEGFGVRISLSGHDMNGFALGPDGRIYGTIGDRGFSVTTKEGKEYHYPNEGAVFRFEPDGTGFEIYHTGLRNPKEIAFDAFGNAISVDNNSDQGDAARVVYLVEGGDSGWEMEHQTMHTFHRQIGLANRPPSRWMDEKMWELRNDTQPAYMLPPIGYLTSGPSGLTVHPGTGFLEEEAGRFLICDYRGGASNSGVWSFEVQPEGAGMKLTDQRKFAWGIGATDVEYSWDGKVFISDFVNGWKSHDDGRIVSLDAGDQTWRAKEAAEVAKIMKEGFATRSANNLAALLKHADARIRLRAQIQLTRRQEGLDIFTAATASENQFERLHGIWGLGILARRGSVPSPSNDGFADLPNVTMQNLAIERLLPLIDNEDNQVTAQVLKVLADTTVVPNRLPLGALLFDSDPKVRYYAAIAIGKLKDLGQYGAILEFLKENNNQDLYLRHAGIFALQKMAENGVTIDVLSHDDSPAVRLAALVALRRLGKTEVFKFIGDPDDKVNYETIRAITDLSLDRERQFAARQLDDVHSRMWTPFMLRRLIHNSFRIGDETNFKRVLNIAADPKIPDVVREEAFRLVSLWVEPPPVDQLTGHWNPLEKRDPQVIRPALTAALPFLLRQEGYALTAALHLMEDYKLDVAGLDDDDTLRGLVTNEALPANARATALHLYVERKPSGLEAVLNQLSADKEDEVALAALQGLATTNPSSALGHIQSAIESSNVRRSQQAWEILATLPGSGASDLIIKHLRELREKNGVSPFALELMEAAGKRNEPPVTGALRELEKALADSNDPLAKWNIALEGGDAAAGASLFASHPGGQCMRCHRAEDGHSAGGEAGPNLAGIGNRHDNRYFLESLILPSAEIAPGYGATLITFPNGATLGGNLIAETEEHLDLDNAGTPVRIKRSDIKSFTPPISAMPAMDGLMTPKEGRDFVAWLASLKKGGEEKPAVEPQPFDPSTLAAPAGEDGAGAGIDPELMRIGQQQYLVCGACHGQAGEGGPAGPPLAGSEWVTGPVENLIRIQLRGVQGPIMVKGQEYNSPGGMPPMAYQTDDQIAAVLTYIRNSFGNKAPAVSPENIAPFREEVGKPQLTQEDLAPVK